MLKDDTNIFKEYVNILKCEYEKNIYNTLKHVYKKLENIYGSREININIKVNPLFTLFTQSFNKIRLISSSL